jgi:S-adenosylmethionine:tRNA ribosyltransferase-isomerase
MSAVLEGTLTFELPDSLVATGPIEATGSGKRRDDARLLVTWRWDERMVETSFADLPRFLDPGDVLVVNTSATLPAAVPTEDGRLLHLSTELPGGLWIVELREPCGAGSRPFLDGRSGSTVALAGGAAAHLLAPFPATQAPPVRLWTATLDLPVPLLAYLDDVGRPIRYGCTDESWPIDAYQTVFGTDPGSAEMPSAGRPFTPELVLALVQRGVVFAPITLHTGVSSPEVGEPPYPERFAVRAATAEIVNTARAHGHRVIAVGTTPTRAIETGADEHGVAHPGTGWTDLVITPERGVWVVDGIITGWHEPLASHLQLLEAIAGRHLLERSYARALAAGYRWHEFGDLHLVLP